MTDTLTVTGEYAYANGMESGWLPWLIKQKTSAYEALFLVGGSNYFGWLAVWGLNSDWRSEWKFRRFGEASTPGVGMRAVPRLYIELCPGIYLTTGENQSKTSVRAAENCLANHWRARFVWSTWPPTSSGLESSAGTRRSRFTLRATGPTLGQSKYLPSCRTKGFSTSANLESKHSGFWCGRQKKEHPNPRESACY